MGRDLKARALVRMYRLLSRPEGAHRDEICLALDLDERTFRRYLADLRSMPDFLVRAEKAFGGNSRFWIQETAKEVNHAK